MANNVSTTLDVKGAWDLTTYGTWNALVQILRIPTDTWKAGPIYRSVARTTTTTEDIPPTTVRTTTTTDAPAPTTTEDLGPPTTSTTIP